MMEPLQVAARAGGWRIAFDILMVVLKALVLTILWTAVVEYMDDLVMAAIRRRIQDDGLLALTIRPIEFWDTRPWLPEGTTADTMRIRHRRDGFAFVPQDRAPIDGEITFGETSISLDYIRSNWTGWELLGHETNDADPCQQILFLRPR